jgi:vacuolar-type H+-ATPase catalytic subunit A/Vma1
MLQRWPVRKIRPVEDRLSLDEPLHTGLRVLDTLFPCAQGGTVAVPTASSFGKSVTQQSICKLSNLDCFLYVSCGERSNDQIEKLLEYGEVRNCRYKFTPLAHSKCKWYPRAYF